MKKFLIALFALMIVVAPIVAHAEDEAPASPDGVTIDNGDAGTGTDAGTDGTQDDAAPTE